MPPSAACQQRPSKIHSIVKLSTRQARMSSACTRAAEGRAQTLPCKPCCAGALRARECVALRLAASAGHRRRPSRSGSDPDRPHAALRAAAVHGVQRRRRAAGVARARAGHVGGGRRAARRHGRRAAGARAAPVRCPLTATPPQPLLLARSGCPVWLPGAANRGSATAAGAAQGHRRHQERSVAR